MLLGVPVAQAQVDTGNLTQLKLIQRKPTWSRLIRRRLTWGVAASTLADEGTPTLGVQFGGNLLGRLELRGVLESDFSNLLVSAEGFYRLSPADALGQPYVGGGVTATGVPSESEPTETTVALLPTLTGGYSYRFGALGVFGELRLLVFTPLPTPELRAGVNVYF